MKKERAVGSKIKFALAAVFVVTVLSTMTLLFVQGVKKQLWEQIGKHDYRKHNAGLQYAAYTAGG